MIKDTKKKLSPYSIGETPCFDPCLTCLVKSCCSEICDARLRWFMKNVKSKKKPIKIGMRKRRKIKK
jgi:hypothetical protein